jgi:hypothetical protein
MSIWEYCDHHPVVAAVGIICATVLTLAVWFSVVGLSFEWKTRRTR